MKIGFVYPHSSIDVPPSDLADAMVIVTWELSKRLARTEEVIIYPLRGRGQLKKEKHQGVTINRIPVWSDKLLGQLKFLDGIVWRNPEKPFRISPLYYPFYARRVANNLHQQRCDIIHVYGIPSLLAALRKSNPSAKLVVHAHDHLLYDFDRDQILQVLRHADLILGCSKFVTQNLRDRFPELNIEFHHLHNGVNFDSFQRPSESRTNRQGCQVLFIGRHSPEKGLHVLLEAFCRVAKDHPEATLKLIGPSDLAPRHFVDPFGQDPVFEELEHFYRQPNDYLPFLKSLIPENLKDRVTFAGSIPNVELPSHYHDADVFVFPSIWHEPFGIPIIEAMATGLPVVASDGGAFPELVVDGTTGFLVPRGNVDQLTTVLDRLIADAPLRSRLGDAGHQRALNFFSWDNATEELLDRYRNLLGCPANSTATGTTALSSQ